MESCVEMKLDVTVVDVVMVVVIDVMIVVVIDEQLGKVFVVVAVRVTVEFRTSL
jgi:hypothetical protein